MAVPTRSRRADASALEALVDAAAGILAADSLGDTLGRIAHHLSELLDYDELSVYEVDRGAGMLVPVFALGAYAEEVMADTFPATEGVTGWVVSNRRTRNVARADLDPIVAVVEGTAMEPESLVSVPLLVEDRVVAVLNVYRIGLDKTFSDAEVAQVERFATMAALAFDSARQRDTLREQARTDGLTGLLNHRACHERLGEEVVRAAALERPLSVVVLDIDHFKTVNDAYGHAEGDKVLVAAAGKLRSAVREDDLVARLGGEEFALILPGVDGTQAAQAAERARAAIAEVGVGGSPLSCSAGVATYPDDASDAGRLLELADGALYWAKRSGRDQSRRYDRRLAGQLSGDGQRAEIEALLAREDSIVPVFQPVLELATGRVAGYEALARMPHGPFRPPDQWFSQAHRAGLGPALEAAALRAALGARGRPERTFLAVNVSPGALLSPGGPRRPPRRPLRRRDRAHRARAVLDRGRARPRARRAARARSADRARRRRQRLLRAAADDPRGARHPQARPLARERGARRPAQVRAARGADLVRVDDARRGLRRGRGDARRPRGARGDGRHLRTGLGAGAAGRSRGRRCRRRRRPRRRPRCGSACGSRAIRRTTRRRRSAT